MTPRQILDGTRLMAKYIPGDQWPENLSFYSTDDDFIQVGTWRYNSGRYLQPHVHKKCDRQIERTQEVIYVKKGEIEAEIYTDSGTLIEKLRMIEGDTLILLAGGHGYRVTQDDTQVLEIKNGPYFGAEKDRQRFSELPGL